MNMPSNQTCQGIKILSYLSRTTVVRTEFSIPRGGFYNDIVVLHLPLHVHKIQDRRVAQYDYPDQQEEKGILELLELQDTSRVANCMRVPLSSGNNLVILAVRGRRCFLR